MSAVDKARALLAKATPGPWTGDFNVHGTIPDADGCVDYIGYLDVSEEDAKLLVAAPALLAALADEVEQLRAQLEASERARKGHHVNSCQLNGSFHGVGCPEAADRFCSHPLDGLACASWCSGPAEEEL